MPIISYNSLNTYFIDIPFLLSMKSDPARYLWFDWQSRWSSLEIQPSSTARYSLSGLPYVSKSFEYTTGAGDAFHSGWVFAFTLFERENKKNLENSGKKCISPELREEQLSSMIKFASCVAVFNVCAYGGTLNPLIIVTMLN